MLLNFGLSLVVIVNEGTDFMHICIQTMKVLKTRLHTVSKRNHKAVGLERYHRFLNHAAIIVSAIQDILKCFIEAIMLAAYAWNAIPFDGTDIPRSIPAIGRPLKSPMNIAIAELPSPINDATKATVSYIRSIRSDARFAKDLVTWLTEDQHERPRERVNQTHTIIQYNIEGMDMT